MVGIFDGRNHPEAAERVFLFRLAKDLGKTVSELEAELSTKEFVEWIAYYNAVAKAEEREARRR